MVDALIVSNLFLWFLVLALVGVVLALVRQVGLLHERVAPAGALMLGDGPSVGEDAPRLEVEDWAGRRLRVGGPEPDGTSTLLFFLSPSCPVCKTLLPVLDSIRAAEPGRLRLVLASDGPRGEHERFVREHRLAERNYVLSTELGMAYRIEKLPYAVLIDEKGVLRARGLVNSREHLESLFEAMERETSSLQAYLAGRSAERRVA